MVEDPKINEAIIQEHETLDGKIIQIAMNNINNTHKYRVKEPRMKNFSEFSKSVSSVVQAIDVGAFGAGVRYAISEAKKTGKPDQANDTTQESIDLGTALHKRIEDYIRYGSIDTDDQTFMNWYDTVGKDTNWVATEVFCYDSTFGYGGTIDALSFDGTTYTIWDWKTKNTNTYRRNWYYPKDRAQLAGYARALMNMESKYYPVMEAKIAYVMRDSDLVEVQSFNIGQYITLFESSWHFTDLVNTLKDRKTKEYRVGE